MSTEFDESKDFEVDREKLVNEIPAGRETQQKPNHFNGRDNKNSNTNVNTNSTRNATPHKRESISSWESSDGSKFFYHESESESDDDIIETKYKNNKLINDDIDEKKIICPICKRAFTRGNQRAHMISQIHIKNLKVWELSPDFH